MALNLSQLTSLSNQQQFVAFFDPEPFFFFFFWFNGSKWPIPKEAEVSFCPVNQERP